MNISKNKEYKELINKLRNKHFELSTQSGKGHKEREVDVYRDMINIFYEKNKRYPTALEFSHANLLPSARLIQRNYGGLKKFREFLGLPIADYTSGKPRTEKMKIITKRAKQYEQELFILIHKKYHKPDDGFVVEREPVIGGTDPENDIYAYKRADIAIHNYNTPRGEQKSSTFFDFFYASTKESFFGCVNLKIKKIKGLIPLKDITFVCTNPNFSKDDISSFTLPKNSPTVISYKEFKQEFID
jgi:hypothetical protein